MFVDKHHSAQVTGEWTIWRTPSRWRAVHDRADKRSLNAWGPLRRSAEKAVQDAQRLRGHEIGLLLERP